MKRSEINTLMRNAVNFARDHQFHLPPFAFWSLADWLACDTSEIVAQQLGWDITDFGSGDYSKVGLLIFALRNGTLE